MNDLLSRKGWILSLHFIKFTGIWKSTLQHILYNMLIQILKNLPKLIILTHSICIVHKIIKVFLKIRGTLKIVCFCKKGSSVTILENTRVLERRIWGRLSSARDSVTLTSTPKATQFSALLTTEALN